MLVKNAMKAPSAIETFPDHAAEQIAPMRVVLIIFRIREKHVTMGICLMAIAVRMCVSVNMVLLQR
ncbi:MAG: hypothetical protein Greene101449_651 [Candidatus Peregrinibacteria bacterium Greene1014_49]|nr:MAG: hypothetical protein Greene101449_651 [Candidatus Peregrinibacteria bacterium Greene1014_49]